MRLMTAQAAGAAFPAEGSAGGRASELDPQLRDLLAALSVYRAPADRSVLLFLSGPPERPAPEPEALAGLVATAEAAGLLIQQAGEDGAERLSLTPRAAAELQRLAGRDAPGRCARAHRQAAEYWQWRAAIWPQSRQCDLHDLLEARHHLLAAGDLDQACALTESLGAQLHAGAEHDRAASLLRDMLGRLPGRAAVRHARLLRQLGTIAEAEGDHGEAAGCYREALVLYIEAGDRAGAGGVWHSLGILAQAGGDYAEAERCFAQASLADSPQPAAASPPRAPAVSASPGRALGAPGQPATAAGRDRRAHAAAAGPAASARRAPGTRAATAAAAATAGRCPWPPAAPAGPARRPGYGPAGHPMAGPARPRRLTAARPRGRAGAGGAGRAP